YSFELLAELVHGLRNRCRPRARVADAVEESLATRVQRDVGPVPVTFAREDGVRRYCAIVHDSFELRQLAFDQTPQGGSNFDVATREFKTHGSQPPECPDGCRLSKAPSADWKWGSSALPGTWRSCAGPARALRAAGCSRSSSR